MPTTLDEFLISIGWEIEGEKATTESDKILDRIRGQSAKAAETVGNVFKAAATAGVAAVGAIGAAAAGAIAHYVELGAEVGKTASQLGLGTTELQRLQAAQKATGGSTDALKDAIKTLNIGLQEAATKGSGPFWEGLQLAGVALEELEGLSAEQQIGLLADALNEIKDPADQAATRLKLFGEGGGAELAGLLSRGSAGIRELGDEAERLGLVMDETAVAGAQRLASSMGRLQAVGSAVVGQVGAKLAPMLENAADKALAWVAANQEFIEQDLPAAIDATISALGELVTWLVDVQAEFRQFGREVGFIADEVEGAADQVSAFARAIYDEAKPAIDVALWPLRQLADVFLGIQEVVVGVVAEILELVGVLEDVKGVVAELPFVGEDTPDADVRAGDFARGPATFIGEGSQANADAAAEARRQVAAERAAGGALAAAQLTSIAASQLAAEGRERSAVSSARGRARARGRALLAPPKSGGGGGSKTAAKGGILDKLGLGELFEDKGDFSLAGMLGGVDHAPAGGGSSPLAGATFATQTVNTTATVTIELPSSALAGLTSAAQADVIAEAVRDALDVENRRALDYVAGPIRRG